MAIQFLCPACSQPIEIDQEWSGRPVACPYCRKTVVAPETSTFDAPTVTPQATPIGAALHWPAEGGLRPVPAAGNPLALWALGLAAASLVFCLYFQWATVPRMIQLAGPEATPEQMQQALFKQISGGQMPGWLIAGSAAIVACLAFWVAGLVCGLIAVTRPGRRRLAYAGLGLSGLTLFFCCLGPGVGS